MHVQKTPTKHSRKYGRDGMVEDFQHSHTLKGGVVGTTIKHGTKIHYIFITHQNENPHRNISHYHNHCFHLLYTLYNYVFGHKRGIPRNYGSNMSTTYYDELLRSK